MPTIPTSCDLPDFTFPFLPFFNTPIFSPEPQTFLLPLHPNHHHIQRLPILENSTTAPCLVILLLIDQTKHGIHPSPVWVWVKDCRPSRPNSGLNLSGISRHPKSECLFSFEHYSLRQKHFCGYAWSGCSSRWWLEVSSIPSPLRRSCAELWADFVPFSISLEISHKSVAVQIAEVIIVSWNIPFYAVPVVDTKTIPASDLKCHLPINHVTDIHLNSELSKSNGTMGLATNRKLHQAGWCQHLSLCGWDQCTEATWFNLLVHFCRSFHHGVGRTHPDCWLGHCIPKPQKHCCFNSWSNLWV